MVDTSSPLESTFDWSILISMTVDAAIVSIAVVSLWVAISALRHQRNHDNKVMEHDHRMSEPYVAWSFGGNDSGEVIIGLSNEGPGAARFVRSTILVDGVEFSDWTWLMLIEAIARGEDVTYQNPQITMPKYIKSGQTVNMITLAIAGMNSNDLLDRVLSSVEIQYFYRSVLSDEEILTDWATPKDIGLAD